MVAKNEDYRVMLINSPNPTMGNTSGNYAVFPAMGIVNLGTRIKRDHPDVKLYVLDGGNKTTLQIKRIIDEHQPSLITFSVLTPTYSEGLELAKYAKERHNSRTVLGNDHASFFPELILQNRPFIDYVVQAEFGEDPLSYIVGLETGKSQALSVVPTQELENIYFRGKRGEIQKISFKRAKLADIIRSPDDIPDLSLIGDQLPEYADAYNERYGTYHDTERKPSVINNVRGCGNGEYRCTYCSIYDLGLNAGNPELFWDTVERHNEEYGINFFFEVCDSFLSFQRYIKQLIKSRPFDPKERDIEFEIYARANDVVNVPNAVDWLRELNITRVNLGLDSGDDNMLNLLRKRNKDKKGSFSPAQINYDSVKRLAEAGITIHASFPLGSLGETSESLTRTVEFIERIGKDFGPYLTTLEASELVPLPHSPAWDMILSRKRSVFKYDGGLEQMLDDADICLSDETKALLRFKYDNQDLLDVDILAKDWIRYFTHVDWDMIEDTKSKVEKIAGRVGAIYGRAI